MKLKSWVQATLIIWGVLDLFLLTLALYMQRVLELGLW